MSGTDLPTELELPVRDADVRGGRPSRLQLALVLVGLFAFAATIVLTAVVRAPGLSFLDEWTHADYAYRAAHGQIPARGDAISPQILAEWSCHGGAGAGRIPPCGADGPAAAYVARGEQYNFGHPPLYYLVTGTIARVVDPVLRGDFIDASRSVGMLWLFAAMAVMYAALRRFRLDWRLAVLGAAALPTWPVALHASATVSNDVTGLVAGAAAIWLLARLLMDRRTGWLLPVALTLLASATKELNAIPFLCLAAVALVLAGARLRRRDTRWRQYALLGTGVTGAFLLVHFGWAAFQDGRGATGWVSPTVGVNTQRVSGLPFNEWLLTLFSGIRISDPYQQQSAVNSVLLQMWGRGTIIWAAALPLLVLVLHRRGSRRWVVGAVTALGLLAYPLAVQLQAYLGSRIYFPAVTGRYGMSMIPWLVLCALLVAARTRLLRTAAALTAFACGIVLVSVFGLVAAI